MRRIFAALFLCAPLAFSQSVPSFNWAKEVDSSGTDTLAGVGTDAAGNVYIAGTTYSPSFPVKSAVQGQMASSGLYRISGSGYMALGLSSVGSLAVGTQNPALIYAISRGILMKSSDGGVTFSVTSLPTPSAFSVVLQPGNDQVVFAATLNQGLLKSSDGGATWTPINNGFTPERNSDSGGQITVQSIAIDPTNPRVMFVNTPYGPMRTTDGGASWEALPFTQAIFNITFDPFHGGVVYVEVSSLDFLRSSDFGATFTAFNAPKGVQEIFPDPLQAGRLIALGAGGIYQSVDGSTWMQTSTTGLQSDLVADLINGVYYAATNGNSGVVRISGDLRTVTLVGPPATELSTGLAVANGQVYAANGGSGDVFVMKLDAAGNIVYSTFFGGSRNDQASAMTVDAAGNVFVTGTTNSLDFPVSKGAYASTGTMFVFRLNADGSTGYSTYFSGTNPVAIATDGSGSAWMGGQTQGGLPTTPMALSTTFCCATQPFISIGPPITTYEATLTRFDAAGSSLAYSTYVAGTSATSAVGILKALTALAVARDGSAYVGGGVGIFHVDAAGASLISSVSFASTTPPSTQMVVPTAMALGPDGSLYMAGAPGANFRATAGAFQTTSIVSPPVAIVRVDAGLANVLDSTYFTGNFSGSQVKAMTTDSAGNVYIGGSTAAVGLPTRTPFAGGFGPSTGYLAEFSGDLSSLLFSSYFGDTTSFAVSGVSVAPSGAVVIGGVTGSGISGLPVNLWLNSLTLTPPPALRIDTVANAASVLDTPLAAGETIEVKGAGFGAGVILTIGGETVPAFSISPAAIYATVPADLPSTPVLVQVQQGRVFSNAVVMPTAITSPGIFTQDGSGAGLAYVLNGDGTLNTPSNPARSGDRITVFATGVGPVSFTNGYAVTEFPVNVLVNRIFCAGVAALMGPVSGFPGSVYRITVYVPQFSVVFPLSSVVIQVNGVSSEAGVYLSLGQ